MVISNVISCLVLQVSDEQCNGLNSGLLCKNCEKDSVFSFEAFKCIPSSNWQPFVILIAAVLFQLVLGFGIVIGLTFAAAFVTTFKTKVQPQYYSTIA